MLNLPKKTQVNKMVAKSKFYEHGLVDSELKASFVDDVEKITWVNKISSETMNVESGNVKELQVFHIKLKNKHFNPKILETIDKAIPYHILYVLEYDGKYMLQIAYKEKTISSKGMAKTDIAKYFKGKWQATEPEWNIEGQKLDTIYHNLLASLSDGIIDTSKSTNLQEQVAISEEVDILQKQIDQLTQKMYREKQFNRKCELNRQIKQLQQDLEKMRNGI